MPPLRVTPYDLFAFGNKGGPRPPRVQGYNSEPPRVPDLKLDTQGMVGDGPEAGASTFEDPYAPRLSGHYWRLPAATDLGAEMAVVADGTDRGGRHSNGHHTLYPYVKMNAKDFVDKFMKLPWVYGGKI